jgi:hypothetical protein
MEDAKIRKGLEALSKASGISELFEKSYSNSVYRVRGFTVNEKTYILVGEGDMKLHVYDEHGNELFRKSYFYSVYGVHIFMANKRAYILVGGKDEMLHVYDIHGNELFRKSYFSPYGSYSNSVNSVHGFIAFCS